MSTLEFSDNFTGTNGDAWDSGKWTTSEEGSSSANTDIQSNEGRMQATNSVDDFSAATANADTDVQEAEALIYVDPTNYNQTDNAWIYLMLRSSGEQVAANAGRPATAYYWRADLRSNNTGMNLYRRVTNSETLLTGSASSRSATNVPFWMRMATEDSGSDVIIRVRAWDDGSSEPGTWDINHTDTSPGILHGATGKLQLVARSFSSSGVDVRVDDVEFWDLDGVAATDTTTGHFALMASGLG